MGDFLGPQQSIRQRQRLRSTAAKICQFVKTWPEIYLRSRGGRFCGAII